ncbi:MAG TPA: O-antigen ligase family protein [Candidatus Saccharimonadales bacterium]|nr:O-antigen ligase family protein [Candidatus Saccharimonadales bacterium]
MRAHTLKYRILWLVAGFSMLMILLMPLHAFLTVWGASLIGHYTALRLWKEALLLLCIVGTLYLVVTDGKIRGHTLTRKLAWLVMFYIALNIGWGLVALHQHTVTAKAMGYGWILDLRFLIFFLITWAVALRTSRLRKNWQWMILLPAAIVVIFGLLEALVLPHDFLSHFGYGPNTIQPYETINHNQHYVRILSTLRGANPLGAYLLIPISVLTGLIISGRRSWPYVTLYIGSWLTLFFSFSRSAWIGAVLTVAAVSIQLLDRRHLKPGLLVVATLIVLGGAVFALGHHSERFENYFTHTQTHSAVKATSDEGHWAALKNGLREVWHQPFGRGPGSAGPASIYNNHSPRIAENYYVQIAQETGWIGLILFLLINAGVGYLLYVRRRDPLAVMLYGSMIGISFINLLSHAWADDTLAYVWWGLAGVAMVPLPEAKKQREAYRR